MFYEIKRTRTISEFFWVKADTFDEALSRLADSDIVQCKLGVEQTELSTRSSTCELLRSE